MTNDHPVSCQIFQPKKV